MMAVSPRMRNALTLFSSVDDVLCHRVRLVLAAYSTRSRSTRVGTEWYGLRSIRSSGGFCGATDTKS